MHEKPYTVMAKIQLPSGEHTVFIDITEEQKQAIVRGQTQAYSMSARKLTEDWFIEYTYQVYTRTGAEMPVFMTAHITRAVERKNLFSFVRAGLTGRLYADRSMPLLEDINFVITRFQVWPSEPQWQKGWRAGYRLRAQFGPTFFEELQTISIAESDVPEPVCAETIETAMRDMLRKSYGTHRRLGDDDIKISDLEPCTVENR